MKPCIKKLLKILSPIEEKEIIHLEDVSTDNWLVTDEQKDALTIIANGLNDIVNNPNMVIKYKQARLKLLTNSLLRVINNLELIKE